MKIYVHSCARAAQKTRTEATDRHPPHRNAWDFHRYCSLFRYAAPGILEKCGNSALPGKLPKERRSHHQQNADPRKWGCIPH